MAVARCGHQGVRCSMSCGVDAHCALLCTKSLPKPIYIFTRVRARSPHSRLARYLDRRLLPAHVRDRDEERRRRLARGRLHRVRDRDQDQGVARQRQVQAGGADAADEPELEEEEEEVRARSTCTSPLPPSRPRAGARPVCSARADATGAGARERADARALMTGCCLICGARVLFPVSSGPHSQPATQSERRESVMTAPHLRTVKYQP